MKTNRGFTLVEMLIVIGIISILSVATMMGFSKMTKSAEAAKAQDLVIQAATALTAIYDADGAWPKKIRTVNSSVSEGRLDDKVALILAKRGFMSLSGNASDPQNYTQLTGKDRFGVLTPWADKVVSRMGSKATLSSVVNSGTTVDDHILHFAVDLDGDGKIETQECGGRVGDKSVRATAVVWCTTKDGKNGPDGSSKIKSWTAKQEEQ